MKKILNFFILLIVLTSCGSPSNRNLQTLFLTNDEITYYPNNYPSAAQELEMNMDDSFMERTHMLATDQFSYAGAQEGTDFAIVLMQFESENDAVLIVENYDMDEITIPQEFFVLSDKGFSFSIPMAESLRLFYSVSELNASLHAVFHVENYTAVIIFQDFVPDMRADIERMAIQISSLQYQKLIEQVN